MELGNLSSSSWATAVVFEMWYFLRCILTAADAATAIAARRRRHSGNLGPLDGLGYSNGYAKLIQIKALPYYLAMGPSASYGQ